MTAKKFRIGVARDALDKSGRTIFDPALLDMLADPAVEWAYFDAPVPELTPEVAAEFDALCVMGGRIGHAGLAVGRVRLIARFGVGYDNVDVTACTEHGALLTLAPDGVRRPVAASVIALVLALAHKLLIKDKLAKAGRWAEKLDHIGMGLTGRTLGAIGMGNIGAEVFRLAQPFGMRLIAHDPLAKPEQARTLGVELVDLDTVLRTADFVSVMCPLSERTRGLIGPRELGLMKPTAYLINTARGPIVQEKALTEALAAGRIAGAGLDVFEVEPTPADNPLLRLDNVIATPHGICFTDECLDGLARSVFTAALAVAHGRRPAHVVNPEAFGHPALRHLKG